MSERRIIKATLRDTVGDGGEDRVDLECRFDNGEKYAPVSVDAEDEDVLRYILSLIEKDINSCPPPPASS